MTNPIGNTKHLLMTTAKQTSHLVKGLPGKVSQLGIKIIASLVSKKTLTRAADFIELRRLKYMGLEEVKGVPVPEEAVETESDSDYDMNEIRDFVLAQLNSVRVVNNIATQHLCAPKQVEQRPSTPSSIQGISPDDTFP